MWLAKRAFMLLAGFADLYGVNRLEHWVYDQIIARGWEGVDTFIRLELFDGASAVPLPGPLQAEDEYDG